MARDGTKTGGGSRKGIPNKKTVDVTERLKALNCDPIEGMARIALGDVECPRCHGVRRAKFTKTATGWEYDVAGVEMDCRACNGTGKELIDTKLRGDMFKELAQYVAPKRKAIEHSGDESLLEAMLARLG